MMVDVVGRLTPCFRVVIAFAFLTAGVVYGSSESMGADGSELSTMEQTGRDTSVGSKRPEDVPELGPEDIVGGEATPRHKPVIKSIKTAPEEIYVGVESGKSDNNSYWGRVVVDVGDLDTAQEDLDYYYYQIIKDEKGNEKEVEVLRGKDIPMSLIITTSKRTIIHLRIQVFDETRIVDSENDKHFFIPILIPGEMNENIARKEMARELQNWYDRNYTGGALDVEAISVVTQQEEQQEETEETSSASAATGILNSPTPWQNALVQECVRQYLDRVAFPVENRLDPGKFTHIDEWGRLLGPNLRATGPVEGFWDNPTHFVWSQYGSARATARYGVSLRDYVADCIAGLAPGAEVARPEPADAAAARERQVVDLYNEAQAAIEDGNARARSQDMAGAQASYQRALDALRRAQQSDVVGKYAQALADAIALVERNLARVASPPPVTGGVGPGLVTGPDARETFDALRRDGRVGFTDLENLSTGLHTSLRLGDTAITLRTTEFRYPLPERRAPAGTPVAVLPYNFVTSPANHRFMGVTRGNVPDGQSQYEFVLSKPASHVGLMRNWNTNSLTRFYNEAGALLAEHRNTTNHEFVSYVADRPENRVHRIEFDGVPEQPTSGGNKIYQVGEVDDLYVGTLAEGIGEAAGTTIENPTVDGIALDNCLYWGMQCGGEAASNAFCKSRGYDSAVSWRTRQNSPPTKTIGDKRVCEAAYCGPVVQVVCE